MPQHGSFVTVLVMSVLLLALVMASPHAHAMHLACEKNKARVYAFTQAVETFGGGQQSERIGQERMTLSARVRMTCVEQFKDADSRMIWLLQVDQVEFNQNVPTPGKRAHDHAKDGVPHRDTKLPKWKAEVRLNHMIADGMTDKKKGRKKDIDFLKKNNRGHTYDAQFAQFTAVAMNRDGKILQVYHNKNEGSFVTNIKKNIIDKLQVNVHASLQSAGAKSKEKSGKGIVKQHYKSQVLPGGKVVIQKKSTEKDVIKSGTHGALRARNHFENHKNEMMLDKKGRIREVVAKDKFVYGQPRPGSNKAEASREERKIMGFAPGTHPKGDMANPFRSNAVTTFEFKKKINLKGLSAADKKQVEKLIDRQLIRATTAAVVAATKAAPKSSVIKLHVPPVGAAAKAAEAAKAAAAKPKKASPGGTDEADDMDDDWIDKQINQAMSAADGIDDDVDDIEENLNVPEFKDDELVEVDPEFVIDEALMREARASRAEHLHESLVGRRSFAEVLDSHLQSLDVHRFTRLSQYVEHHAKDTLPAVHSKHDSLLAELVQKAASWGQEQKDHRVAAINQLHSLAVAATRSADGNEQGQKILGQMIVKTMRTVQDQTLRRELMTHAIRRTMEVQKPLASLVEIVSSISRHKDHKKSKDQKTASDDASVLSADDLSAAVQAQQDEDIASNAFLLLADAAHRLHDDDPARAQAIVDDISTHIAQDLESSASTLENVLMHVHALSNAGDAVELEHVRTLALHDKAPVEVKKAIVQNLSKRTKDPHDVTELVHDLLAVDSLEDEVKVLAVEIQKMREDEIAETEGTSVLTFAAHYLREGTSPQVRHALHRYLKHSDSEFAHTLINVAESRGLDEARTLFWKKLKRSVGGFFRRAGRAMRRFSHHVRRAVRHVSHHVRRTVNHVRHHVRRAVHHVRRFARRTGGFLRRLRSRAGNFFRRVGQHAGRTFRNFAKHVRRISHGAGKLLKKGVEIVKKAAAVIAKPITAAIDGIKKAATKVKEGIRKLKEKFSKAKFGNPICVPASQKPKDEICTYDKDMSAFVADHGDLSTMNFAKHAEWEKLIGLRALHLYIGKVGYVGARWKKEASVKGKCPINPEDFAVVIYGRANIKASLFEKNFDVIAGELSLALKPDERRFTDKVYLRVMKTVVFQKSFLDSDKAAATYDKAVAALCKTGQLPILSKEFPNIVSVSIVIPVAGIPLSLGFAANAKLGVDLKYEACPFKMRLSASLEPYFEFGIAAQGGISILVAKAGVEVVFSTNYRLSPQIGFVDCKLCAGIGQNIRPANLAVNAFIKLPWDKYDIQIAKWNGPTISGPLVGCAADGDLSNGGPDALPAPPAAEAGAVPELPAPAPEQAAAAPAPEQAPQPAVVEQPATVAPAPAPVAAAPVRRSAKPKKGKKPIKRTKKLKKKKLLRPRRAPQQQVDGSVSAAAQQALSQLEGMVDQGLEQYQNQLQQQQQQQQAPYPYPYQYPLQQPYPYQYPQQQQQQQQQQQPYFGWPQRDPAMEARLSELARRARQFDPSTQQPSQLFEGLPAGGVFGGADDAPYYPQQQQEYTRQWNGGRSGYWFRYAHSARPRPQQQPQSQPQYPGYSGYGATYQTQQWQQQPYYYGQQQQQQQQSQPQQYGYNWPPASTQW